jgi:hypothetical protein
MLCGIQSWTFFLFADIPKIMALADQPQIPSILIAQGIPPHHISSSSCQQKSQGCTLFVGELSRNVVPGDLFHLFSNFGKVILNTESLVLIFL